jgi:hypothetical protein
MDQVSAACLHDPRTRGLVIVLRRVQQETGSDRVISTSWLKAMAAFFNTDGGHRLTGASDDGSIRGLSRDAFKNADVRERAVRERVDTVLGVGAHRLMTYSEPIVKGQRIVHIQCRPAMPEYVWFHPPNGSSEELWVRTGPKVKQLLGRALAEFLARRSAITPASD